MLVLEATTMDKSKIYCTKMVADDQIECYDRQYQLLGTVDSDIIREMSAKYQIVQVWVDWTGGESREKGTTLWWSTYE